MTPEELRKAVELLDLNFSRRDVVTGYGEEVVKQAEAVIAARTATAQISATTSTPAVETVSANANETAQVQTPVVPALQPAQKKLSKKEIDDLIGIWKVKASVEEMVERLESKAKTVGSEIPVSEFHAIVRELAPASLKKVVAETEDTDDAEARDDKQSNEASKELPPYAPELEDYIKSGVVFCDDGFWLTKRCSNCGGYKHNCCDRPRKENGEIAVHNYGELTLNMFGREVIGLDPIRRPEPPKSIEQEQVEAKKRRENAPWWRDFRGGNELTSKCPVTLINSFLVEGICIICGLSKDGKSFVALEIAKSLTSGRPLFGQHGFEVPEITPVMYLAAESFDGELNIRRISMGITDDKNLFICRTLSQGSMLPLDGDSIKSAIKEMRPVVVLETLVRFGEGDEDSVAESRRLAQLLLDLLAAGARAVVAIHHSRKDLDKKHPTKEAAVRGSGDLLAMTSCGWIVCRDENLYRNGAGPNEVNLTGWARDSQPQPIRVALTRKRTPEDVGIPDFSGSRGIISYINTEGGMKWVPTGLVFTPPKKDISAQVERLITEKPTVTLEQIMMATVAKEWRVRRALKELGYQRGRGDCSASQWTKTTETEPEKESETVLK